MLLCVVRRGECYYRVVCFDFGNEFFVKVNGGCVDIREVDVVLDV